jgi:hypothetical protein
MPIATITAALSSLKAATEIAKIIKDSGYTLEKAEIKLKIADMLGSLADTKINLAELQDLLLRKDKMIKELEVRLELKEKLKWESPYYWLDSDGKKEGPFCQQCYDNGGKLIHLQSLGPGSWICKTCDKTFHDSSYRHPTVKTR